MKPLIFLAVAAFISSCAAGQIAKSSKDRYVQVGSVTCREPLEEVSVEVGGSAKVEYGMWSIGAGASYSEKLKRLDDIPADAKIRERIEFKLCMDYGNKLISPTEYKLWSLSLHGDATALAELHQQAIAEQTRSAKEPETPSACGAVPLSDAKVVVAANRLLAGGRSNSKRREDISAVELIDAYMAKQPAVSATLLATSTRARLYAGTPPQQIEDTARQGLISCANHAGLMNYLAAAKLLQGDKATARTLLEKSIQVQPDYAAAHANLGALELMESHAARAAELLRRATELDGSSASSFQLLARAYLQLSNLRSAEAAARTATELEPNNEQARTLLRTIMTSK